MTKALSHFTIEQSGEGFVLNIEDEDGAQLGLTVTSEQLDLISEAIDEHLDNNIDDLDEVED